MEHQVIPPEIDLLEWRKEFPILERCIYLISNSLGALPRQTRDSLQAYADLWETRGVEAWSEVWWEMPGQLGDRIGTLIGASPGEVSIQPNVTTAQWVILSCFETSEKNKVVYSDMNFPSVRYFYQSQPNLKIEVVGSEDGITVPLERLLDAIDEETLLVPISHVIYKSGFIQDVESIIRKAHSVGAYVVLDTYHSTGLLPYSVSTLGVDFAVGGVLKWLCGGPGTAFLYVNPALAQGLSPRLTGWLAHTSPFDFEPEMDLTNSAYRFMSGTPNIPGIYAARRGLEIIEQITVEAIRERSIVLTQRIIDLADDFGLEIKSPREVVKRGGHISLNLRNSPHIAKVLLKNGFLIDFRPDSGIRIAPHFYNTEEEIDLVMNEIHRLERSEA